MNCQKSLEKCLEAMNILKIRAPDEYNFKHYIKLHIFFYLNTIQDLGQVYNKTILINFVSVLEAQ